MMADTLERLPQKGDIVRAETSAGIAKAKGWITRVISGEVLAITEKAVLVKGTADCYADDGCMICGRTLQKFTSRAVYIGPVCAAKNGLFYPTDEELSDEQKEEIRTRIRSTWEGQAWMPKAWTRFTVIEEAQPSHALPASGPSEYGVSGSSEAENRASGTAGNANHSSHRVMPETPTAPVEKVDVRFSVEVLSTAKTQGRVIVCRSRFEHKDRCTSVSPRTWDGEVAPFPPSFPRPGAWTYPVSAFTALQLKNAFEGLNRRGTPAFTELLQQSAAVAQAGAIKEQTGDSLPDIPCTKTAAWEHQKRAFWFTVKLWGGLPDEQADD